MAEEPSLERTDIIARAYELIRPGANFILATVDGDAAPHTRWMGAAALEKPDRVYMVTGARSHKVVHIEVNPQVQMLFNSEGFEEVAAIGGIASVVEEDAVKRRIFEAVPTAGDYFEGPEDPNFAVIAVRMQTIELVTADHKHAPFRVEL